MGVGDGVCVVYPSSRWRMDARVLGLGVHWVFGARCT